MQLTRKDVRAGTVYVCVSLVFVCHWLFMKVCIELEIKATSKAPVILISTLMPHLCFWIFCSFKYISASSGVLAV